jgi:glycosyltransferase involved in cell wall biosynthesis
MRITIIGGFFLPVPAVAGGAMEKIWLRLAQQMAAAGHEVTYFSRTWPGFPDSEIIDGIRMERVKGFTHTRRLPVNLVLDFLWGLRVYRRLPRADIVVCNTVALPVYLSRLKPSAGKVVVVLGRMPKGQSKVYGGVDRIVATSVAVQDQVLRENARLADRTCVIPNPIDWALHQQPPRMPGPVTIGYVGRMNPEKGIEILLQAAAELARRPGLPAWKLRLVGPQKIPEGGGGEAYVAGLRDLAACAGAEVTIDPPIYDPVKLAQVYGTFDIFCYPSLAEKGEGLSVAPLEAMAAGAVPVVSALECYHDVIRDRANGMVFNHRDPQRAVRLADIFAELLTDSALRHRLAEQARVDSKRFDYGDIAAALLRDFEQLRRS